jgi:hypothetical protein
LIAPSAPSPTDSEETQGNLLSPEYVLQPPENQVE